MKMTKESAMTNRSLLPNEAITFALRSLYDRYGYSLSLIHI